MNPLAPAFFLAPLAVFTVAGPQAPAPSPSPAPREVQLDRLQWGKDVDGPQPVTSIEVRNDFGDIRARAAGDRRLEATMVVQRLDPAGDKVGFTVERRGGTVALVVAYPPGRVRDTDPHPAKDSYDRLDLVVFVPAGVTLRAHSLRGRVEARGLKSDVEAATLDGPILVRTSGTVQARTGSGEITALLDAGQLGTAGAPLLFQSDSGPIEVTLPPQGEAELRVLTEGEIASRLNLHRSRREGRTEATLGPRKPARLVLVSSRTGKVTVERDEPALLQSEGAKK
jgi:hypothetical protein